MKATALHISVQCDDGRWRMVILNSDQSRRIKGYVQQVQGGTLRLHRTPMRAPRFSFFARLRERLTTPHLGPQVPQH